jgi:uncharacterized protein YkwD
MGRTIGLALVAVALLYPLVRDRLQTHGDARVSLEDAARCPNALTPPTAGNVREIREATLCLLNRERARENLPALRRDERLELASQRHSEDMAERRFFAHDNPDGTTSARRMARAGYEAGLVGENLAWGGGDEATPEHIVVGWMNSPGHRRNILEPRFEEIGVGVTPRAPEALAGRRAATYTTDFGSGDEFEDP